MSRESLNVPFAISKDDVSETLYLSVELSAAHDIDLSLFATNEKLKLLDDSYFVFYNQQATPNRELRLLPETIPGKKQFALNLHALPTHVRRITFAVTSEQSLSGVGQAQVELLGKDKIARHTLSLPLDAPEQAAMLCEFALVSGQWHLQAIGQMFQGGLGELLAYFGGASATQAAPVSELPSPAPDAQPTSLITAGIAVPIGRLRPQDAEVSSRLMDVARRIPAVVDQLQTEEATKHALVMPFIQALGYDVFNPLEVTPELTADVGVKKGEKVDYAILNNGQPIILMECKHHAVVPNPQHASQLYRYFSVTEARFAILTNGIVYKFYTDLEKPNTMDSRPFLEINMLDVKESDLVELLKFAKHAFDQDEILSLASEMKYVKAIKKYLAEEFAEPSDEFIKLLTARVFEGRLTSGVRNRFALYAKKALNEFVAQIISDRLRDAFTAAEPSPIGTLEPDEQDIDEVGLLTSTEEWQAFYIIRSILRENVNYARIHLRKHQSYSSVLLDNNRRKAVCRLYFTEKRLQIGLFDKSDRQEARVVLDSLDDIFKHADRLLKTVKTMEAK